MMRTLLNRIRPQVMVAILLLGAISGYLVYNGAVEGAVGLAGSIAMLSKEVIQADNTS
jgi:hypothetical protein